MVVHFFIYHRSVKDQLHLKLLDY